MPVDKLIKGKLYELPDKIFYEYVGPYTHTHYKRGEYETRCRYAALIEGEQTEDERYEPSSLFWWDTPGMFIGNFEDLRKRKDTLSQSVEKTVLYIKNNWPRFIRYTGVDDCNILPVFLLNGKDLVFPYFWDPTIAEDDDDHAIGDYDMAPLALPTYNDYLNSIAAL